MFRELLMDFVFPKTCAGCGVLETYLCEECINKMDISSQICPMCGRESIMGWTHKKCRQKWGMDGLIVLFDYQEPVIKAVLDRVKYEFNQELLQILLRDFVFESGVKFDVLVPVPLYYYRENWRGFNQAELIANILGTKMMIPTQNLLTRIRNTKQQALMRSVKEREMNIKGAFEFSGIGNCREKNVLLVDDVFTSGADMRECTLKLKSGGAECVWGLAVAH